MLAIRIMMLLVMQFSVSSSCFLPLTPKCLPQSTISIARVVAILEPYVTCRNMLIFLLRRTTPYRLSATADSIYLQLHFMPTALLLDPEPENAPCRCHLALQCCTLNVLRANSAVAVTCNLTKVTQDASVLTCSLICSRHDVIQYCRLRHAQGSYDAMLSSGDRDGGRSLTSEVGHAVRVRALNMEFGG
jgi:hypothetical protein